MYSDQRVQFIKVRTRIYIIILIKNLSLAKQSDTYKYTCLFFKSNYLAYNFELPL